jgi:4-azaleucine resistance transporter AzlC
VTLSPAEKREFVAGLRAVIPLLIGVAPFGPIYGVVSQRAGLPPAAAQAMSVLVFAGSAQFVAVQLITSGAPWALILMTTVIINLRHLLYGGSLAPYFKTLRPLWKWGLAYFIVDEVYTLGITRYRTAASRPTHCYVLGSGVLLWLAWQTSTAAGILLGAQVPPAWGLDFTLALTILGLMVPGLTDRASLAAAACAGVAVLFGAAAPLKLGLVLAAVAGIGAGLLAEGWTATPGPPGPRQSPASGEAS